MTSTSFPDNRLTLHMSWSPRVSEFAQQWEERLAVFDTADDAENLGLAALMVMSTIENGQDQVLWALGQVHELTGQWPIVGDALRVGPLELRVDERCFELHSPGGVSHIDVRYSIGVERYRYEGRNALEGLSELLS